MFDNQLLVKPNQNWPKENAITVDYSRLQTQW